MITNTDPMARVFFAANTGITSNSDKRAINNFCHDIRAYGLISKIVAFYPIRGGTATTHKYNLIDPTLFQLDFQGSWVHSSTGALPDGSTAYAKTGIIPSTHITSGGGLGFYSGTNANTGTDQVDFGCTDAVSKNIWISCWYNGSGFNDFLARNSSVSVLQDGGVITDSTGFYLTSRSGTTNFLDRNGLQVDAKTDTGLLPNVELYLSAINGNNINIHFYSNRECRCAIVVNTLTVSDRLNLSLIIQKYQRG